MKSAILAAMFAATLSLPALAQDTMGQPPAAGSTTTAPADAAMPADTMAPPSSDMSQPPAAATPDASTSAMPEGGTPDSTMTPPADSSAMTPPPPPMSGPGATAGAPAAGDPSTYPTCSRTVKDRCVNREASRKRK